MKSDTKQQIVRQRNIHYNSISYQLVVAEWALFTSRENDNIHQDEQGKENVHAKDTMLQDYWANSCACCLFVRIRDSNSVKY